jgi:hypothetical protein
MKAGNGFFCDGGYMKLLQEDSGKDLAKFDNDARYTIMFGPDRCGATDKVHPYNNYTFKFGFQSVSVARFILFCSTRIRSVTNGKRRYVLNLSF